MNNHSHTGTVRDRVSLILSIQRTSLICFFSAIVSKPIRRQQPTLIDYGIIRRPGIAQESLYGYDDGGELYTDYYDYYEYADYDYPAKNKQDAKTKDSNRLFVNFILNALGPRRPN